MQLTKDQKRVLTQLRGTVKPLGAYELLDHLRRPGFKAPTQVYRALNRLNELGLVHRFESFNAYIACSNPERCRNDFTALAICEQCGRIDEFFTADLRQSLEQLIKSSRFSARGATIEIFGKCQSCNDSEQAES